jgi:acetyl-CoA carboxylase biotin carboxyl carrier protein
VDVNTEVCIIEVMKLFTAVRAGVRGTVRKVLVNDADMVEFNQPLILIEPAA